MYRVKALLFVAYMALALAGLAASVSAGIPPKINYQGRLTDLVTGGPRVGSVNMTFRLYDAAEGGSELWSESHVVVADSAGVVSIILGSTTPIEAAFDDPAWLQVEVMGDILTPRRELVSVPYAFRAVGADSLDGYGAGDFVLKGEMSSITAEMIVDGPGSGLDADMLDGLNADAFAESVHTHDNRYYTQDSLNTPGAINDTANPVDWSKLKGVPSGFADGIDDVGDAADGHSLDADDGDPVDALYVDAEGDVGIGTTTPGEKLEVTGTVRLEGFNLPSGADSGFVLTSDAEGVGTWQALPVYADTAHNHDDLYYTQTELNTSDGDSPNAGSNRVSWDNLTDVPSGFADGSDDVGGVGDGYSLDASDGDPLDAVYVDENGRVGMGTLDPMDRLHVHLPNIGDAFTRYTNNTTGLTMDDGFRVGIDEDGDASLWNYEGRYFRIGTDDTERLRITNAGDVGIGTYNPQADLHIHNGGIGGSYLALTNAGTGSEGDNGLVVGISSDGTAFLSNHENNSMLFETTGNIGMTLSADSRLAVGGLTGFSANLHVATTSPSESCYVRVTNGGTGHTTSDGLMMRIAPNGNAALLNLETGRLGLGTGSDPDITINADGDVGIGTQYPEVQLHLHEPASGQACAQHFTNATTGTGFGHGLRIGIDSGGNAMIRNYENAGLSLATNDWTRMKIDSNGNVGIGDSDPKVKLAVSGIARIENIPSWPSEGEGMELAYDATLDRGYIQVYDRDEATWGTLSLGSGNVGIGTGNPALQLEIKGDDPFLGLNTVTNKTGLIFQKNGATAWEMAWNEGSGYLYFYRSGTRMVIEDATGEVGIGTASPGYKLDVAGECHATGFPTSSDARFKDNVEQLTGVLDKLDQVRGVAFDWNERYEALGRSSGHREIGVIAQEVEAVFPELVSTWGDGDYRAVDYGRLTGVLIEAIKELRAENDTLRTRIEALEDASR